MDDPEQSSLAGWAHAPFLEKVTGIAPNIIYIFNQETQSNEYANRSLGVALGYTAREIQSMGDAFFSNLCHPDDLGKIFPYFDSLRQASDGEVCELEYRMKHKQGGWVWLLSYDTVFERNESGEVIRHLGIATDISRQKKAQEHAEAERRAADAANEELRSFAYSISHDMKSPSNTLHGLLTELKEQYGDTSDPCAQTLLDMSLRTAERMQNLVEDVLRYTRVIGDVLEFEQVDLNVLIHELLQDMQEDIRQSGVEILVDLLPTVQGSRSQLTILFQNLINNALKYHAEDSQPKVLVNSTRHNTDQKLLVHVIDNGIGIDPKHHKRIFEMFKRLHVNEDYPGTGLGLTICKRIASLHGATLTVESAIDEGSRFTVSFES